MNRLALILALSGTVLLPIRSVAAPCDYGFGETADAAEEAGADAAAAEAAAITMVTRSVGTVEALSADVSVTAPDTPEGLAAIEAIRAMLPAIDEGFVRAGLSWPYWAQVDIELSGVLAPELPDGTYFSATTGCLAGRCEMQFYLEGWATAADLAYNLAHEFAHVGQGLRYKRVNNAGTGWWYEGTAEWFANLVVPGMSYSGEWIAEFDRRSQDTSLTSMCYEGVAFFLWAGERFGPTYPFGMGRHGESVLEDAGLLARELTTEDWFDFVETFLGGDLRYPDGRPAWPGPSLGPSDYATAGTTLTITGPALSIPRLTAEFVPGEWQIQLKGTTPFTSFSDDDTASWFRVRNSTLLVQGFTHTAECGDVSKLVMATIGVPGAASAVATIEGEEDPCLEACDRPIPRDHCMVGAWTALSTDLPDTFDSTAAMAGARSEWVFQDMGDNYVVLRPDGTYVQAVTGAQSEFEHEIDGHTMRQRVLTVVDARGRWSVVDDQFLIMCTDEFQGLMLNEMTAGGVTQTNGPFPIPYDPAFLSGDGARYRYACAGDTADITLQMFAAPDVGWHVQRVPMPPPPDEPF